MKFRSILSILLSAVVVQLFYADNANATGSITCWVNDTQINVNLTLGAGPILNVVGVRLDTGNQVIATIPTVPEEQKAILATSYIDENILNIDLVDDQAENLLATIRVLRFHGENVEPLQVGYLRLGQEPPNVVKCDGP